MDDVVADSISVRIRRAPSSADSEGIELVAVAVTIAFRNVGAAALVQVPHSIAYSAGIVGSDAGVHVVADSVGIRIGCARAATDVDGIEGIALAVAVSTGDSGTPSGQAVSEASGWLGSLLGE